VTQEAYKSQVLLLTLINLYPCHQQLFKTQKVHGNPERKKGNPLPEAGAIQ